MRIAVVLALLFLVPTTALSQPQSLASASSKDEHKPLHPLLELKRGYWAALGTNTLFDVRYVPEPGGHPIKTIMTGWSGAAYNSDLHQLWVHGGGHGDGADNAVYAFDVETLTWIRLFDPSTQVTGHTGRYYLDGKPAAVHSQDYVEYLPSLKMMIVAGARGPYPGVAPYKTCDAVDASGTWLRLPDVLSCEHPTAAIHPETGVLWQHGGEASGFLSSFRPEFAIWNAHGDWKTDHLPGATRTSAIDPKNGMFVVLNVGAWGDNNIWVWDIRLQNPGGEISGFKLNMKGDTEILFASGPPGLDWHPGKKKLYAWHGGVHVYEIDVAAETITKVKVHPYCLVVPTPGTKNGVFGRWRYVEKYDVFMGVNAVDEPVYFFKLPK